MSKKDKKKNKKSYFKGFDSVSKGKKKKNKGGKGKRHDLKLKTVNATLSKKEAHDQAKEVLKPVKVSEKFTLRREKCNHAANTITAAEFKEMTPSYAAFTPMLDSAIRIYGEENVRVCKKCYDVVVAKSELSAADIDDATTKLYAICNCVVANRRMSKKEVIRIARLQAKLRKFNGIKRLMKKVEDSAQNGARAESANLNDVGNGGSAFIPG